MPDEARGDVADHGDTGRGVDNLDPIENLLGDDPDEIMQTGYSPPDREPRSLRARPTLEEQREGQSVAEYLSQEEPDVSADKVSIDESEGRAGRLVTSEESGRHRVEPDGVAQDLGPAGYASSAEDAAMHVTDDGDLATNEAMTEDAARPQAAEAGRAGANHPMRPQRAVRSPQESRRTTAVDPDSRELIEPDRDAANRLTPSEKDARTAAHTDRDPEHDVRQANEISR